MTDPFWAHADEEAAAEWEAASSQQHTGDPMTCALCVAGDGDPRCQRCGRSVGFPGCECPDGYLAGPCLTAIA